MPDVYRRNWREYRRVGREFPQGARRDEHRVDFLDLQAARCPAVVRERADARRLAADLRFPGGRPFPEYGFIREARPNQSEMRRVLDIYLENCKFANCRPNDTYVALRWG